MRNSSNGIYNKIVKRVLDFMVSFLGIIFLSPLFVILSIMVRIKLGSPVIFKQKRPGKDEKIFTMYKFRTMTNATDEKGKLLSDGERLTKFGRFLRNTSMDELPELFNILKGDMSIVGPRPQLIKDMIFMSDEQRRRHSVRQGLTGLAQVNGRNNISWEEKIDYDLQYIDNISFWNDLKILVKTVGKVFKSEDVNTEGMDTAQDYCDYQLATGKITKEEYDRKLSELDYDLKDWKYYNQAIISAVLPYEKVNILPILDGNIWKVNKRALFVRWTENFDCGKETKWWYCIKDDVMDICKLPSRRRYKITRGLKNVVVNIESPKDIEEEMYVLAKECFEEYPEEYRGVYTREEHHKLVEEWDKDGVVFVARGKEDNDIKGYVVCIVNKDWVELSVSKVPHRYQSIGTNAALAYEVCMEILNRRGYKYLCDGARNIKHKTNYQDYLIKFFGFRRAYCDLKIEYRFFIKICVYVLYPFRKVIKNTKNPLIYNVYCILKQEEYRRG